MSSISRRIRGISLVTALALGCACVEVHQVAPGVDSLLPSVRESAAVNVESKPFSGLRLESRLAGSLMELEFAPGLDVAGVVAGSPAEAAGIRVGDRVIKVDGASLETVEQFDATLAAKLGEPLRLEVERGGAVAEVTLTPTLRAAGSTWNPSRFAERLKVRLVLENLPANDAGFACGVVEILAGSPCSDRLAVGDVIVELDGEPTTDARDLAQRLARLEFGAEFSLTVAEGETRRVIEFTAYDPPRRITALSVPILFTYTRDFTKDELEFEFIDLFLLKLYGYYREGARRRVEILWFTIFETGVGEIRSEPDETEESR